MSGEPTHAGGGVLRVVTYLVGLFIALPILVVVASSFTAANYMTFPPEGFTLKWYGLILGDPRLRHAVRISFTTAAITAALAVALGIGVSLALERYRFRGRNVLSGFVMAPLTVPSIVLALGMIFFMTAVGLIRTMQGLVLSHLVVAMPYAVRALSASIAGVNRDIERSAAVLGAPPLVVLLRVTLPLMRPGIMAALAFSFLASFNNVTISLFVAGPRTQTLPLEMFKMAQEVLSPSLSAIASSVMGFSTLVMLVLEKRFGIYGVLERQRSV
ncbi:MAG: hypothetical protein A2W26_11340 [Acidobacteria bacterium RBG_16_64_8]|nr:MAG: hypothetical protein A2W26_11340 [Acidobacteria bacterium RBG_16_64_8]